jgi:hypothetical protein
VALVVGGEVNALAEAGAVDGAVDIEVNGGALEAAFTLSINALGTLDRLGHGRAGDVAGALRLADGLGALGSLGKEIGLLVVEVGVGILGGIGERVEVAKDLAEEGVELRVLLDVGNAVTASANDSVELLIRGLIVTNDDRSLHIEGKVLVGNNLVDIEAL